MSQNPNSVQSNENLPSPVDKRMRKFVCPSVRLVLRYQVLARYALYEMRNRPVAVFVNLIWPLLIFSFGPTFW